MAPSPGGVEIAATVSETVMILPPAVSDGLSPFVKIDLSLLADLLKSVKRSQAFFESRLCGFFTQIPACGSPVSFPLETQSFQCGSRFCHINSIVGQPLRLPNCAHPTPACTGSRKRRSTARTPKSKREERAMEWRPRFGVRRRCAAFPLGLPILSRPDHFAQRRD